MLFLFTLRKFYDRDIAVSFVGGKCFIAVPIKKDLLEAPQSKKYFKADIQADYETVHTIIVTLESLHLEQLL